MKKVQPGFYEVLFSWSPDSRYVGIYYEGRIQGESIVFDTGEERQITLPMFADIYPNYGEKAKPQEYRPDPYFAVSGWENEETVIVEFKWTMEDGEEFSGRYSYNINENKITFK